MTISSYQFDVLVVGAGHAGTEAALAAARLGAKTALLTTNLDTVGQMSCNPAIGGVGKGQIVREIDALGGAMAQAIDATGIQFRMLNRRKGPAMHSPRAQADKRAYQSAVKHAVEQQPNLVLRQETVEELIVAKREGGIESSRVATRRTAPGVPIHQIAGLRVAGGAEYRAQAVVLTTGTFLQALMHTGEVSVPGGRAGESTTQGISRALERLGIQIERFKTGTPPRINGRTIDYDKIEEQPGDDLPQPFSFLTERIDIEQLSCHITYTNEAVHDLIRQNLDRAPMYSGTIQSSGAALLPVDRRQSGSVRREVGAPDFPGAGRPTHDRSLRQRHPHEPASRRAGRDASADPGAGAGGNHAVRLRGRVRLRPAPSA